MNEQIIKEKWPYRAKKWPFRIVEEKLREADFFLRKLTDCDFMEEGPSYYFSAFLSAARSVTFSMQAALKDMEGFDEWYGTIREKLRGNELAQFFLKARNESQKEGKYHLKMSKFYMGETSFHFFGDEKWPIGGDVAITSRHYMRILMRIVFDCYTEFGPKINPYAYYTVSNMKKMNKSIEEMEDDAGIPRGTTTGIFKKERMRQLRKYYVGLEDHWNTPIDDLICKYIGSHFVSSRAKF